MLKGRKIAIILSGVLFCGLWLFFTQRIQDNQLSSHEKSVSLMMSLAEENMKKFFQMPLVVKQANVSAPFSFLLSLDYETLEPKFFAKNKTLKSELSALSIKSAYKSSGKKNDFFIYESKKIKHMPFIVRVSMNNDVLRLEGMPLRNIQNALGYAFTDQNWIFTNHENLVLTGSVESKKRLRDDELSTDYIKRSIAANGFKANIYVKKDAGYSVALANIFGLLGIGLITFALMGFTGGGYDVDEFDYSSLIDDLEDSESTEGALPFDENIEEDVQMVRLEANEAIEKLAKATPVESEINHSQKQIGQEGQKPVSSNELDYSDFLMENPILGEAMSLKSRPVIIENKPPAIKSLQTDNGVSFVENKESKSSPEAQNTQNTTEQSPAVQSVEALETSNEDEWLRLAEELTESLEEFAQNYDDTPSENTAKDLKA